MKVDDIQWGVFESAVTSWQYAIEFTPNAITAIHSSASVACIVTLGTPTTTSVDITVYRASDLSTQFWPWFALSVGIEV